MLKQIGKKSVQWMLKEMAVFLVRLKQPQIVAITGSAGKTTTKEMVWQVLGGTDAGLSLEKTLGNKNSEFGLPVSIIGFNWTKDIMDWVKNIFVIFPKRLIKFPKVFVAEMGADKMGDIAYLCKIAPPRIAVITNIGTAHLEKFGTLENTVQEKGCLIESLSSSGVAILNADDPHVMGMSGRTKGSIISYGFSENADVRIQHISQEGNKLNFELSANNQSVQISMNLLGKHFALGAAAAAAVGISFGLSLSEISRRLGLFKMAEGRSQLLQGNSGELVIHDAYNANPASMRAALEAFADMEIEGNKIAVLGDMLELGSAEVSGHKEIGIILPKSANILLAVGERGKIIADEAQKTMPADKIYWLPNALVASTVIKTIVKAGDAVLVKGSKAMKMRKVVEALTDYKCSYE